MTDCPRKNLVDSYWNWTTELIRDDLQKNAFPFAILVENLEHDFNISTVIRSGNAFGAKEIYYYGKKKFDRRGTTGAHHYSILKHLGDMEQVKKLKEEYQFVAFDNVKGSVPLEDFVWPKNPLMIFGSESLGISAETMKLADSIVAITQYGSVRSLNAGCASTVGFYDYTSKYTKIAKQNT